MIIVVASGIIIKNSQKKVKSDQYKIGFLVDTLIVERWQRESKEFEKAIGELGAISVIKNANGSVDLQIAQINELIKEQVDVLVIIPCDSKKLSRSIQKAKRHGIKVIAYDRLIEQANVDIYITFNSYEIGRQMAEHLLEDTPQGNYLIFNGAKQDYNSTLLHEGIQSGLKRAIDNEDVKLIGSFWVEDWIPENIIIYFNALIQEGIIPDVIIAANDRIAEEAIQILSEYQLTSLVKVVGQDADLVACQYIIDGSQYFTIYKPVDNLAKEAAIRALGLAKAEKLNIGDKISDGKYDIPYIALETFVVTKDNMKEIIIDSGFHKKEDVYRNVVEN